MDPLALINTPKESSNPTHQRSLNNQIVLEEDEYTSALSQIIARDFFPTLVGTDYLDSQRPPQGLSDTATATQQTPLQLGDTPFMRPGETPCFPIHNDEGPARKRRKLEMRDGGVNTDLSLDDFQARYTSEDNASFTSILNDENSQRKERYKWAYDAERRVIGWKEKETTARETMLLTGGEAGGHGPVGVRGRLTIERPEGGEDRKLIEAAKSHDEEAQAVEAAEDVGKALVVSVKLPELTESEYNQVSKDPRGVMAPTKDTRSAAVPGWEFKARNAFMFSPDANESPYDPSTYTALTVTHPKSITHSATRMPTPPPQSGNQNEPPSPTHSRVAAAIAGVPYQSSEAEGEGKDGFAYVPTLPTPRAEVIAPNLMTTGTLLATPRILSGNTSLDEPVADPQTPFRINAPSRREQAGLRLSAKASKSLREKAALLSGTGRKRGDMMPPPTPGGAATPRRVEGLTPAARALLQRSTKTGATPTRREFSMGGAAGAAAGGGRDLGKVKWTPSPVTRR